MKVFLWTCENTFLGHIVSKDGIHVDPDKVSTVKNYPTPTDLDSLHRFLGLAGYYRRFIEGFSKIAQKHTAFKWTNECQQAFDKLHKHLTKVCPKTMCTGGFLDILCDCQNMLG